MGGFTQLTVQLISCSLHVSIYSNTYTVILEILLHGTNVDHNLFSNKDVKNLKYSAIMVNNYRLEDRLRSYVWRKLD